MMRQNRWRAAVSSLAALLLCLGEDVLAKPEILRHEVKPQRRDNFLSARFTLRHDPAVEKPRALLVLLNGYNGEGESLVLLPGVREFADRHGLLLATCTFTSEKGNGGSPTMHYAAAENGSGAALDQALAAFAEQSRKPGLKDLPLLFYGYSAGGMFGYGYACWKPERVLAVASLKGGIFIAKPKRGTYGVPMLFFAGENDSAMRLKGIEKAFRDGAGRRAPWCHIIEQGTGHERGQCGDLVLPFFAAVIERRLPAGAPAMKGIDPAKDGVFFSSDSGELRPTGRGNKDLSWLTDEDCLAIWRRLRGM